MARHWIQCNNLLLLRVSIQSTISHISTYFHFFPTYVSWQLCTEYSINDSFQNKSDRSECSHIIWWSIVLSSRNLLEAVFKDKQTHFAALLDYVFVYFLCICICVLVFVYLYFLEVAFKDKHFAALSDCAFVFVYL